MVISRVPSFSDHLLWCESVFSISASADFTSFVFGDVLGDMVSSNFVAGESVHVESKTKKHKNNEENE
jgi:hypothetical protein